LANAALPLGCSIKSEEAAFGQKDIGESEINSGVWARRLAARERQAFTRMLRCPNKTPPLLNRNQIPMTAASDCWLSVPFRTANTFQISAACRYPMQGVTAIARQKNGQRGGACA
jgi:hypothetical protein